MKTMDRVFIPANEAVIPHLWDTMWYVLAWHAANTDTPREKPTVWLWRSPDQYCMIDRHYVQLVS